MPLDAIDKRLLSFLQENSKQTHKELSLKLNLSVTAVFERIKKLEREGVIENYVALVDKDQVDRGSVVFCHIKLLQHSQEYLQEFEKAVMKLEEVMECYHVSGEYDYLIKVLVRDMKHFRSFMVTKLTSLRHIGSTQSSFSINEVKHTTAITLN